jgi:DNA-binding transcriptional ArsR family regulator
MKALYAYVDIYHLRNMHLMLETLSALAEPNRFQIVELLHQKPRPVGEIADNLNLRQPQASKHLRVLSKAGLVKVYPNSQQRIYALQPRPFKELDTWLESYRELWEERFDRLDDHLTKLEKEGERHDRRK